MPYSDCDDTTALSNIRAGKMPERPSDGITDPVWQFLEECWSKYSWKRPSATRVYYDLSIFGSMKEIPEKLKLLVRSIKIPLTIQSPQQFSVKFKYGNMKGHTTPLTTTAIGDEYMWFAFRPSLLLLLSLNL